MTAKETAKKEKYQKLLIFGKRLPLKEEEAREPGCRRLPHWNTVRKTLHDGDDDSPPAVEAALDVSATSMHK